MATWSKDERDRIGRADELQIAPLRRNGTLGKPVTIWVVRHGDDLYVRSYKGADAAWFRGIQARHEGRIWAGGVEKDVTFVEETDPGIADRLDAEYRTKYHQHGAQYVDPMVTTTARAATIRLMPRETT
jgi:hypothetical protein